MTRADAVRDCLKRIWEMADDRQNAEVVLDIARSPVNDSGSICAFCSRNTRRTDEIPHAWEFTPRRWRGIRAGGAYGSTPAAQQEEAGSNPALPSSSGSSSRGNTS